MSDEEITREFVMSIPRPGYYVPPLPCSKSRRVSTSVAELYHAQSQVRISPPLVFIRFSVRFATKISEAC